MTQAAIKLTFLDKLAMAAFAQKYQNNPDALAKEYHRNPQKWEALKSEYPEWERYASTYPEMREKLRKRGVPV